MLYFWGVAGKQLMSGRARNWNSHQAFSPETSLSERIGPAQLEQYRRHLGLPSPLAGRPSLIHAGLIDMRDDPAAAPRLCAMGHPATAPIERDLRVDFFRGLALLFIFIDHVPGNAVAKATLTNFGFVEHVAGSSSISFLKRRSEVSRTTPV